jgi:hypothetical protein
LHSAVRIIEEGALVAKKRTVEEKKGALVRCMDHLAQAFSILTSSSCRCCVKVTRRPSKNAQSLEVVTYSRSSGEQDSGGSHPIEHNTDFNYLYQNPSAKWFFGNNLPELAKKGQYNNTNSKWQTSYKSTIVWPIRKPTNNQQSSAKLLGFLCVDSKRTKPFSEEFDYPIGGLTADALYQFLADFEEVLDVTQDGQVQAARVTINIDGTVEVPSQQGASEENG